jgi:DNA-binding NtrC family response regulator
MPEGPHTTILVVEDETLVRLYSMDILEEAGFKVLDARDADEAMALLGEHNDVTLLFSDINMPGSMNGMELARVVHDRWPNIRLLLTSGHQQPSVGEIPDDGCFMRKPWGQDALIRKIRDILTP